MGKFAAAGKAIGCALVLLASGPALPAQEVDKEPAPLEWPRSYTARDGSRLLLFQPQIIAWDEWERLEARAVVAVERPGQEDQVLGIARLAARTEVSTAERLVRVFDIELLEVNFPAGPQGDGGKDPQAVLDELFPEEKVVSLDRLLANLERAGVSKIPPQIKAEPPPIFASTSPAVLVQVDGEPILADVREGKLQFVVNTNWDLFFTPEDRRYYLLWEGAWLETGDVDGRWQPVEKLPKIFKKVPADDPSFAAVRASVPGERLAPSQAPRVFFSTKPAELVVISGQPQLQPIGESDLLWVTNTESDLFVHQGDYLYLVAGRWFRAPDLDGPWSFASEELPPALLEIPEEHPRARVRPSVPGTPEAEEAVILAQIPQKATVTRGEVAAPEVVYYAGEPSFEPIDGTSLERAANTQFDVILAGGRFYLCYEAVWFVSDTPEGPWQVADTIPAEVYTIPASSPSHAVTYVQVYESTPTNVTYGYTSGYWGVYLAWGCAVYGTGWYWNPYYYYGPYYRYPIYYPYPVTYGVSAWYNPNTGTYGRGGTVYGPYGGMGRGAAYNPRTGAYARGGAAWGPYNARGWAEAYNPTTGTYARTRQGADVYGSWGATGVRRGDDWLATARYTGEEGTLRRVRTSEGSGGFVARGEDNLYAGRDGNVYRRGESGWQKYGDGEWSSVERPDAASGRDISGRTGGETTAIRERPSTATQPSYGSIDRTTHRQLDADAARRQRGERNLDRTRAWQGGGGYGGRGYGGGHAGGRARGIGGRRR